MCRAADRLPCLCAALHLTPHQFAYRLNLPLCRATRLLHTTRRPSDKLLARVLGAFPEVAPAWLCCGEGPMLRPAGGNHVGTNYGTVSQIIQGCSCAGTIQALQAHLVEKERTIQLLLAPPRLPLAA